MMQKQKSLFRTFGHSDIRTFEQKSVQKMSTYLEKCLLGKDRHCTDVRMSECPE